MEQSSFVNILMIYNKRVTVMTQPIMPFIDKQRKEGLS